MNAQATPQFRPIRRSDHQLSEADTWDIIERNRYGMFSVNGDHGYPYSAPMFYLMIDGVFYIHGTIGPSHRTESLAADNRYCMVITELDGDRTSGRSVIMMGRAIPRADMRARVLSESARKFFPSRDVPTAHAAIPGKTDGMEAYELQIEHLTGKILAANVFKEA